MIPSDAKAMHTVSPATRRAGVKPCLVLLAEFMSDAGSMGRIFQRH